MPSPLGEDEADLTDHFHKLRTQRIALVLPDLRCGGVERMRANMAAHLLELGYKIDFVLLRAQGELLFELPQQARVIDLKANRFRNAVRPLTRYLKQTGPDAVLADMWPITAIAILANRAAGSPARVVVSEHNTLSLSTAQTSRARRAALRLSLRLLYPRADARIAVSNGVADDLAVLSGLARSRFEVIHNPAATEKVGGLNNKLRDPWDGATGKRILSVGRLKEQKDHATLIRAFAEVRKSINATLVILGEGHLRADLERLIADLNLGEDVRLAGFVRNPAPWYEGADLFALSSRWEGFGNVIVEALQCGTPVVSTDCPSGPREILCEGSYGRLVPVGQPQALATAMLETLSSPPEASGLRARALDFTVEKAAFSYLRLLLPKDPGIRTGASA